MSMARIGDNWTAAFFSSAAVSLIRNTGDFGSRNISIIIVSSTAQELLYGKGKDF